MAHTMTTATLPGAAAFVTSRGTYELAQPRVITHHDMEQALKTAVPPRYEGVVVEIEWRVDDVLYATPLGKHGCRLMAVVKWLLIDGGSATNGSNR